MRHYSWIDQVISCLDKALFSVSSDNKASAKLLRVNHSGEVCAQALYKAQAAVAQNPQLIESLTKAAEEEQEHLDLCFERIQALGGRTSYLNPLWAAGSYAIGLLAGLAGDKWSLGFVAETEFQVAKHLEKHLKQLPSQDHKTRALLIKMREDELRHATTAMASGGETLPRPIKQWMAMTAKIMTTTATYI